MEFYTRNRFARARVCLAVALFSLLFSSMAVAAEASKNSYAGQILTVGSELDYPPYALVNEKGEADGYSVDLIKAVARELGIHLKFETGPWNVVKAKLERGEIDMLPLVAYSHERDKHFDFSTPHIISYAVAFTRKGDRRFNSIEDLRGREVIVMRADSTHEYVLFSHMTDKITLTDSLGEAFEMLASGKHDFVVAPKLSGLLLLNQLDIDNLQVFGDPFEAYGKGYSFAVHEGNAELLAELDRGLALVKASGEYNRIYDKWFGQIDPREDQHTQLIRQVMVAIGISLALIIVIALWNLMLRKQMNRKSLELKASETRFAATFEEAAIGLAHVAPDGSWLRVNQALCGMIGYTSEELMGKTFQDITHPDDLDADLAYVQQMLNGELTTYSMEKRYFHKNGGIVWINLTVSLVRKESGDPDYFISAVENISERKHLLQLVTHERNQAQKYLDVAAVMMLALNEKGEVSLINAEGLRILGYEEQEIIGQNWFQLCLSEGEAADVEAVFKQLMAGKINDVGYHENSVVTKQGEERLIAFHNSILQSDGKIVGILSSGEDVTERRENERRLRMLSQAIEQA